MLFDFHVHFGKYFDDYYTPPRVLRTLSLAGITHFAYSSTSAVVTAILEYFLANLSRQVNLFHIFNAKNKKGMKRHETACKNMCCLLSCIWEFRLGTIWVFYR